MSNFVGKHRADFGFDAVDGHHGGSEKEFAHVDLFGGTGSEAKIVFGNALLRQELGFNGLLGQINLGVCTRPRVALLNKIPIKDMDTAVLMFSAAARGIARAFALKVEDGTIPEKVADQGFFVVTVFINYGSTNYQLVEDNNHEATKLAIDNFMLDTNTREHMLSHKDDLHALSPAAAEAAAKAAEAAKNAAAGQP